MPVDKKQVSENRRAELAYLQREIFEANDSCFKIIAGIIALTSATAALCASSPSIREELRSMIPALSFVWLIAHHYIQAKRGIAARNGDYIRTHIEVHEEGLEWETHLARKGSRRMLAHIVAYETGACVVFLILVFAFGLWHEWWPFMSWQAMLPLGSACWVTVSGARSVVAARPKKPSDGTQLSEIMAAHGALRWLHALNAGGIETVGQLRILTPEAVLEMHGIGPAGLAYVQGELGARGLGLTS